MCTVHIVGNSVVEDDDNCHLGRYTFVERWQYSHESLRQFAATQTRWCELSIQVTDKVSNVFGLALQGLKVLQTAARLRR